MYFCYLLILSQIIGKEVVLTIWFLKNCLKTIYISFLHLFLALHVLFIYSLKKKENIILILILLTMFFSFQVYQIYYEPMFFLIYFSLFKTNTTKIFFEKSFPVFILFIYFVIIYVVAVSDIFYKLN